jgi:hypothetical protein
MDVLMATLWEYSIRGALIAVLSGTATLAAELPLRVGMSREEVLYAHGKPKSKIEMETSRLEKWVFSNEDVLVFRNGFLIGRQRFTPVYPTEVKKPTPPYGSNTSHRKPLKKVTKSESAAIFKELEGISEPEGPEPSSDITITQNTRKQVAPHPARPIGAGSDTGEDSEEE